MLHSSVSPLTVTESVLRNRKFRWVVRDWHKLASYIRNSFGDTPWWFVKYISLPLTIFYWTLDNVIAGYRIYKKREIVEKSMFKDQVNIKLKHEFNTRQNCSKRLSPSTDRRRKVRVSNVESTESTKEFNEQTSLWLTISDTAVGDGLHIRDLSIISSVHGVNHLINRFYMEVKTSQL